MGLRVTQALTHRPDISIRVLAPPDTDITGCRELSGKEIQVFDGCLTDTSLLYHATKGVEAVISTVRGIDQKYLLDMSVANGVSRFVPSCYTPDPADYDEATLFTDDLKRDFIDYTFVFNGILMEDLFSASKGIFDFEFQKIRYWGDLEISMDVTSMHDAAEYIAAATLDSHAANLRLNLAGDTVTLKDIVEWVNLLTDFNLEKICRGTVDELKQLIQNKRKKEFNAELAVLQYQWMLFSGSARLKNLDNERYKDIYPTIMLDYIAVEL